MTTKREMESMYYGTGSVETEKASRYLQQLCKHFGHKIPAEFDEWSGRLTFEPGLCLLRATEGRLDVYCVAREDEKLEILRKVMGDHFERFAWKDSLTFTWTEGLAGDAPESVRAAVVEE
ncbi:DUF2218 domain-containing protein [Marivibrio halodurans]|uniref:DUF2218 domain-containing protein n=1 Tax=Marivibrio halodurans TaxID=2039722 RepID=A0A8J7V229_9PROT|nr:DUF2218 domain-containing protein [Marivibrio halodurans]MBP5858406.1 DUF2218 domain-containing protein [Marivibrio halodurans]